MKNKFVNDSSSDIKRKLQKLDIGPVTPREGTLKAAFLVFCKETQKRRRGT